MKNRIRVMLIEDNPDYREVISLALEDEIDIELISQFGTSEIGQAIRSGDAIRSERKNGACDVFNSIHVRIPTLDAMQGCPVPLSTLCFIQIRSVYHQYHGLRRPFRRPALTFEIVARFIPGRISAATHPIIIHVLISVP